MSKNSDQYSDQLVIEKKKYLIVVILFYSYTIFLLLRKF